MGILQEKPDKRIGVAPQRTDLNPMEYLFDHIERQIRKVQISNKQDLKIAISNAFESVSSEVIKTLVQSTGRCYQAVISAKEGPTRY